MSSTQFNMRFDAKTREMLRTLADQSGLAESQVITLLIRNAAQKGLQVEFPAVEVAPTPAASSPSLDVARRAEDVTEPTATPTPAPRTRKSTKTSTSSKKQGKVSKAMAPTPSPEPATASSEEPEDLNERAYNRVLNQLSKLQADPTNKNRLIQLQSLNKFISQCEGEYRAEAIEAALSIIGYTYVPPKPFSRRTSAE